VVVHDGKILLGEDGGLRSFAHNVGLSTNIAVPPPYFEIDPVSLDRIDKIYERVGCRDF
jgi:hypothetical protein